MKKHFLLGLCTAAACFAPLAAQADLNLSIYGYFRTYAFATKNDERAGSNLQNFSLYRDSEVDFKGETTTDNGLTVGVQTEMKVGGTGTQQPATFFGGAKDRTMTDEAYMYLQNQFGRMTMGGEDGIAFLLQPTVPGADSNIDGPRTQLQALDSDVWDDGLDNNSFLPVDFDITLGYNNSDFRSTDRLTYTSPKWKGFQAGVSYAPLTGLREVYGSTQSPQAVNKIGKFHNPMEAAARWDGNFGDFKLTTEAGIASAETQRDAAVGSIGSDSLTTWNAGVNIGYKEYSVGGAYRHSNTSVAGPNNDQNTWIVGAAWDVKPWHLGASWYNTKLDANAFSIGLADSLEVRRISVGGGYLVAPGISLRSTASFINVDNGINSPIDPTQTQLSLGTEVNF